MLITIPKKCKICSGPLLKIKSGKLALLCKNTNNKYFNSHYRYSEDNLGNYYERFESDRKIFSISITTRIINNKASSIVLFFLKDKIIKEMNTILSLKEIMEHLNHLNRYSVME